MNTEEICKLSFEEQIKFKSVGQLLDMRNWQVEFISTHPFHHQYRHRLNLINEIDCELYYRERWVK